MASFSQESKPPQNPGRFTYAAALLAEIGKPGVTLTELFNNVGWAVARATNNAQEPWYSTSPLPKIYLAGGSIGQERPIAGPTGELVVISQPSGAEVVVDGGSLGPAPQTLQNLKAGQQVTVEVRLEGYEPYREQVWIREGQRSERWVVLTKKPPPPSPMETRQPFEPEMVEIPGGRFEMGCGPGDGECDNNENPHHWVTIQRFLMGKYEVTQGQWRAVMGENPSRFKLGDNYPVEMISWNDVQTYLEKLNRKTGKNFRLPTEAEWEYAAWAGTTTAYWWGDDVGYNHANCDGCGSNWDNRQTAPVGSFKPNPWGLYDTAGNVFEWTCSAHGERDGAEKECIFKGTNSDLMMRGGSWVGLPDGVRSTYRRSWDDPAHRSDDLGFRLAKSL